MALAKGGEPPPFIKRERFYGKNPFLGGEKKKKKF